MLRIGLLSDTHGWLDERVFHHFDGCHEVWHAGDIGHVSVLEQLQARFEVRAVWGNIDAQDVRLRTAESLHFQCEGVPVWMIHIGGRPGHWSRAVRQQLEHNAPQLFVCGHSHICLAAMDKKYDMLCLNPGAAGNHGFHKVRTLMRFEIEGRDIRNLQVIELGPRAVMGYSRTGY